MNASFGKRTIGRARWLVLRGRPEIDALLDRIDDLLREGRVVKDLRIKRMIELPAGGRGASVPLLIKIYKSAKGIGRLKSMLLGNRAVQEMKRALSVRERGIDAVIPLAAGVRDGEGIVINEKLEGWTSLDRFLSDEAMAPSLRRSVIGAFGGFARSVHSTGIWQDDFGPSNVLFALDGGKPKFKLIDFERVSLHRSISLRRRLWSIAKMNRIVGPTRAERLRFLRGYLAGDRMRRGKTKNIARQVVLTGRSVAKRDSRRLLRNCVTENRNFGTFVDGQYRGHYRKMREDVGREGFVESDVATAFEHNEKRGFRKVVSSDAIRVWQEMNLSATMGGEVPYLVAVGKEGSGYVLVKSGKPGDGAKSGAKKT